MPAAPLAKGPYHPHHYNQPMHPINKTNTTIAKSGVIIMCAVLIAAGYTVYENRDQVRDLVDRTRRKISSVVHSFAEEIMPSERQPMAFAGRPDGSGHLRPLSRAASRTRSRRNSADSITLRGDDEKAEGSSRDAYLADSALRHRPPYRGYDESSASTNTLNAANRSLFDDDESSRILFDAAAEAAQQHILKRSSPGSDTDSSSDTLSPPMSEKGFPLSHDAPPLIPAVLPVLAPSDEDVIDQPPPIPPRPSHPQYIAAVPLPPAMETTPSEKTPEPEAKEQAPMQQTVGGEEEEEEEELQTTFSTSQPYWAIQQWTEDISAGDEAAAAAAAAAAESGSEIGSDEADHSAVQSLHSESETVSMIDSDEGRSEADDRVEFVSDMASSIGDTDGWSEVGSQFSEN